MMIAIAADILLGGLFWYKNDHFCGATSAENQGGHFCKLCTERLRKLKNGLGVGVGLMYEA